MLEKAFFLYYAMYRKERNITFIYRNGWCLV